MVQKCKRDVKDGVFFFPYLFLFIYLFLRKVGKIVVFLRGGMLKGCFFYGYFQSNAKKGIDFEEKKKARLLTTFVLTSAGILFDI